jgi:hypothetical protein
MFRRLIIALSVFFLLAVSAAAQQPPNSGLDGFVPLDTVPRTEAIPAAPLLLTSYAFFLVLMLFYLWTIWRRLARVEKEMRDLERRQGTAKR